MSSMVLSDQPVHHVRGQRGDLMTTSSSSGNSSNNSGSSCEGESTGNGCADGSLLFSSRVPEALTATVTRACPATPNLPPSRGKRAEFFVEPEWQRAPGRWSQGEEAMLRKMKEILDEDLRASPPFPEVVGTRRMLRFLRYESCHVIDTVIPHYLPRTPQG